MLLLVVAPILGAPDKPSCLVITPCCGDVDSYIDASAKSITLEGRTITTRILLLWRR